MTPRRYGPLAYVPIHRRLPLTWPNGARVALWVNPNVEFFGLDDVMPSNLNDRVPREQAKIPNVRNWAVRDYRVGIWPADGGADPLWHPRQRRPEQRGVRSDGYPIRVRHPRRFGPVFRSGNTYKQ